MENQEGEKETEIAKVLVSWRAQEFAHYERDKNWYALWLITSLTGIILAIIFKNFLFAIFIFFAALAIFVHALQEPRVISFKITARGIVISDRLYPFEELESFWIIYEPPHIKELIIKSKRILMPQINIPIGDENPVKIRQALLEFLTEKEQKHSLIDSISRWLRL
ncbi:hypothetical protein C4553_02435 [Candidatus Parcubacteria bacterium]|nr:MAG: hypothetical protein C4553_02435 [Candidatus Parcubacteria bacterium]